MKGSSELPLVTIAMVTYNQEVLVKLAIESVLNQGYSNFELVISDDCSTDNTWSVITSFTDPRIKAGKTEKNLYQYNNRNRIIEKAQGKYLIFIDGDDLIYPHGLDYMVRMLEAFPDCGYASFHFFRNNIVYPAVITPYQFYISEFFGNSFLGVSLAKVLFKTSVLKELKGFPTKHISSDNLLRYRIALKNNVLVTYHDPGWWRETPGQQSSKIDNVRHLTEYSEQIVEIVNNAECPLNEEEKYFALWKFNHLVFRQIIKYLIKGNLKSAKKLYKIFDFKIRYTFPPDKQKIERDAFPQFTPKKPLMIDASQNPFSSNYQKN